MRKPITHALILILLAAPIHAQSSRRSGAISEADAPQTFVTVAAYMVSPETLEGADVFDANDEPISDVSSVILGQSGRMKNLVFSIGGIWGIGGKPIVVPIAEVEFMRDPAGEDIRVYVNAPKEHLAMLPEYKR